MISLKRATLSDAEALHRMQVEAFLPLYEKYRDDAISPAKESVERVRQKIVTGRYYFILADGLAVGGIRVTIPDNPGRRKGISPLFILREHQNRGYAQRAIAAVEALYGEAGWRLDTILEEPGNCHLYEKLGYVRVGKPQPVRSNMTIIDYEKG